MAKIASDKKRLYKLSAIALALLSALLFVPGGLKRVFAMLVLSALALLFILLLKKRSVPSLNKNQVLLVVSAAALTYVTLLYISGIYFGFMQPAVPINLANVFKETIPIILIIIASEIIRGVLIAEESRVALVASYLVGVFSELLIYSGIGGVDDFTDFMRILGFALLPALSSGIMLTYLTKRYGIASSVIYREVITVYEFLIPVIPAMPSALVAASRLILPILLLVFVRGLYGKKKAKAIKRGRIIKGAIAALCLLASVFFIMLVSCRFKHCLIVVGSESMTGEIEKGDAVVYERYDGQILKEGQVIVFQKEGRTVIHRIIGIERINGQNRYYTKGDANEDADFGFITDSNIVGEVNFKIAYIGYPTLWVRSLFE